MKTLLQCLAYLFGLPPSLKLGPDNSYYSISFLRLLRRYICIYIYFFTLSSSFVFNLQNLSKYLDSHII